MYKIFFLFIILFFGIFEVAVAFVAFDTPSAPYPQTFFNFSPSQPQINQALQFSDNTTCYIGTDVSGNPIPGSCVSWQWNFGDGNTSSLKNPTHAYSTAGGFNATLFVANSLGDACFFSSLISVQSGVGGPTPSGVRKPIYNEVPPK